MDRLYEPVQVALRPGDAMVFYTDGLNEMRNRAGEMYGTERVRVAAQNAPANMEGLGTALLADVQRFAAAITSPSLRWSPARIGRMQFGFFSVGRSLRECLSSSPVDRYREFAGWAFAERMPHRRVVISTTLCPFAARWAPMASLVCVRYYF